MKAADDALYDSKHAGRDRTTVSRGLAAGRVVEALLRRAVASRVGTDAADDRP